MKHDHKKKDTAITDAPGYDPRFDVKGAAKYANRSDETIRRAVRGKELACERPSARGHIRIKLSALNAWLKRMEEPARKNA